jgi:16S rRNA (guanine527-N7)-methyltransferase
MSLAGSLSSGITALGLELSTATQQRLLDYLALLAKWNRTYNLTAVREPQAMVGYHVLDSLAVMPHLAGESLVDVGSGGGLPGIPLAIARPSWRVALVESIQKKAAFLEQCRIDLRLENVTVVKQRVEAWRPGTRFAMVISRAFSDLGGFVRLSEHLLSAGGVMAAMKGVHPYAELAQLPAGFAATAVLPLRVPDVDGARHLVLISKN